MNRKTGKIVISALMAALICVATMIVKIPSPMKGYLNLGDGFVLIAAWILSPVYGFLAAGIGSALADLFSGYIVYAPATFLIKGLMALVAVFCFKALYHKKAELPARLIGSLLAEIVMVLGYYVFEGFLYGFAPAAVNILPNAVQGIAGIVVAITLIKPFEKIHFRDQ